MYKTKPIPDYVRDVWTPKKSNTYIHKEWCFYDNSGLDGKCHYWDKTLTKRPGYDESEELNNFG